MLVNYVDRKSMTIRESGRSSDYITPSFGYGCLLDCTYCYMKRHLSEYFSIVLLNVACADLDKQSTLFITTHLNFTFFLDLDNRDNDICSFFDYNTARRRKH